MHGTPCVMKSNCLQENVRKEIEEVVGDTDDITADHLKELKYTENVIHETMRKYFAFGKTQQG